MGGGWRVGLGSISGDTNIIGMYSTHFHLLILPNGISYVFEEGLVWQWELHIGIILEALRITAIPSSIHHTYS